MIVAPTCANLLEVCSLQPEVDRSRIVTVTSVAGTLATVGMFDSNRSALRLFTPASAKLRTCTTGVILRIAYLVLAGFGTIRTEISLLLDVLAMV